MLSRQNQAWNISNNWLYLNINTSCSHTTKVTDSQIALWRTKTGTVQRLPREQLFQLRLTLISALLGQGHQTDDFTAQTVKFSITVRVSFHELNSFLCQTMAVVMTESFIQVVSMVQHVGSWFWNQVKGFESVVIQ